MNLGILLGSYDYLLRNLHVFERSRISHDDYTGYTVNGYSLVLRLGFASDLSWSLRPLASGYYFGLYVGRLTNRKRACFLFRWTLCACSAHNWESTAHRSRVWVGNNLLAGSAHEQRSIL